jgi:hypothetical protein
VARMGENAYRLLVGKPDGRRPLGRPRCRRIGNVKNEPLAAGWGVVEWIGLVSHRGKWGALMKVAMRLRVP